MLLSEQEQLLASNAFMRRLALQMNPTSHGEIVNERGREVGFVRAIRKVLGVDSNDSQ